MRSLSEGALTPWATVAGWDPGCSGAVCALILDSRGQVGAVESIRFKATTDADVVEFLQEMRPDFTILERVSSFGQGRTSAFKFGASSGFAQGALLATGLAFEMVTPQRWQRGLSVPKSEGAQRKRELKSIAQRMYPGRKLVLEDADAHLLAEIARRMFVARARVGE